MRDEAVFVPVRRSSVDRRHSEYAGTNTSLPGVVFCVALADQLRPLQRGLSSVVSWTSLRDLAVRLRMGTVNIFSGRIDKGCSGSEMFDYIRGALSVAAKAKLCAGRIFIQVSSEVNDGVVVPDQLNLVAKDVMAGPAGKIVGVKKPADVRAQVTTTTGYKYFHISMINEKWKIVWK